MTVSLLCYTVSYYKSYYISVSYPFWVPVILRVVMMQCYNQYQSDSLAEQPSHSHLLCYITSWMATPWPLFWRGLHHSQCQSQLQAFPKTQTILTSIKCIKKLDKTTKACVTSTVRCFKTTNWDVTEDKECFSKNVSLRRMLNSRDLCTRAKQFITLTFYSELDNLPHIMDQK